MEQSRQILHVRLKYNRALVFLRVQGFSAVQYTEKVGGRLSEREKRDRSLPKKLGRQASCSLGS